MAKAVNYTPEMTALAVTMYNSVREESESCRKDMVEFIAEELQKQTRSVVAKLSREVMPDGSAVYIAKQVVSKVTRGDPAKKIELATKIASLVAKVNPETLANAGKTDLVAILEAVTPKDD